MRACSIAGMITSKTSLRCSFIQLLPTFFWSGRTESNCHHEFPGLGCLRYTTPRNQFRAPSFEFRVAGSPNSKPGTRNSNCLAFDADHLFDLSNDFNQVFLVLHHRFDRFVSAGNFIKYAYVFATLNAGSLTSEVVLGEVTLGSSA